MGLGLLAFAPLAGDYSLAALALWSAALPGLLLTLVAPRPGVVYAPTTVVALLFAAVLATAHGAAPSLGLSARQVLAVSGATVALAFVFQWLLGVLRLASVARFLPISVTHGFAAGVGLSMVFGQVHNGFGAGAAASWDARTGWHALAALAVVGLAWWLRRLWPRMPGLLSAVVLVALAVAVAGLWGVGLGAVFAPAAPPSAFAWPLLPDWSGIPWLALAREQGSALVVLALLMALVNSLEILVFNQELELDHGLRSNANLALRRESLLGALCGLAGMIPASTSASRSRIVLAQAGASRDAPRWHAGIMLGVAVTGAWWLNWVPMACLAGGLVLAGLMQVPGLMWSLRYARRSRVKAMIVDQQIPSMMTENGSAMIIAAVFSASSPPESSRAVARNAVASAKNTRIQRFGSTWPPVAIMPMTSEPESAEVTKKIVMSTIAPTVSAAPPGSCPSIANSEPSMLTAPSAPTSPPGPCSSE